MNRNTLLVSLIAVAALAGCDTKPTVVEAGPDDDQTNNAAIATPAELPPSIVASAQYRCKDNSVISIDWLSNGTKNSANVTPKGGSLTVLAQAEAGGDYVAEGATLKGEPKVESVTFNGQSCKK